MINIQSALLILLGFLVANLLVLLLAPAYWRRAVKLTTRRLKQAMPLTESEIRADKDRLRAEYAIKVHRLEAKAEQSAHDSARQQIELNRRDAAISTLEGEIDRLKASLEEHENARRVLEQTITDRFPRVEQRLSENTRQLAQREREVTILTETSTRQARALDEAAQLNAQQRDEMMRLNSSLAAITARTREGLADPKFDAEVALRSELETLRGKLRQQTAQMARLQTAGGASGSDQLNGATGLDSSALGAISHTPTQGSLDAGEGERALALARSEAEAALTGKAELETQLMAARRELEDRSVEMASLKAALAAYERGNTDERSISLKDSRLAMKVRIGALQAESQQQSVAIQRMRSELAAANEKLAKQATHFMAEMRRLGSGAAAGAARALSGESRRSAGETAEKRALSPKPASLARPLRAVAGAAAGSPPDGAVVHTEGEQEPSRVRGFLKALGGAAAVRAKVAAGEIEASAAAVPPASDQPQSEEQRHAASQPRRLVERLSGASKT